MGVFQGVEEAGEGVRVRRDEDGVGGWGAAVEKLAVGFLFSGL